MSTIEGRCTCGAVRLEADLPTKFVAHCHCHNCSRAHGALFVTWAGFLDPQLRIAAGQDQLARYTTETGATRSFCRTCGTPLLYQGPRWPGEVHVAVAVLDGPLDREPQAHVYADRSPAWCPFTPDLPRLGGETGMEPLEA